MRQDYLAILEQVIQCNDEVITFLHNTHSDAIAKKIINEGFEFQSHLDYTTDVVSAKDPVTIKYFTIVRQAYGNFTMIIQINKDIIEHYSHQLKHKEHHFSEILSVKPPYIGYEEDLIYCLAPNFVKGYIDICTSEFVANPNFNPSLILPIFETNLNRILNE
jgi:hypothetical protein